MCFRNYGFPKMQLDKYKKNTTSEYPWKRNMVNGPKQC